MSLPWFRAYAEMVDDAKLRCLAFEDRWHYVAILCCKCQGLHEDAGQELLEDMIGVKLGLQPAERDSLKNRLIRVRLIDELWQPLARSYRQSMPRKMRQLALRCVLSAKASDNELVVVDQLAFEQPSTKEMAGILASMGIKAGALIVTAEADLNVVKSTRNIPGMNISPANLLNVVDVLNGKKLLMTVDAVRKAEELWGEKASEGGDDESVRSA